MASDFVVEISPGSERGRYRTDADSPAGSASTSAYLDTAHLLQERRHLADTVLRSGLVVRGHSPHEEAVRDVGRALFDSVFTDEVYGCYTASLLDAVRRAEPLRV